MPELPGSLTLRGEGVVLRDWTEEDGAVLEAVCGDWDVCRFTSVPWTYTPAAARAWVERLRELRSSGRGLALAITREDEDRALGTVNLGHLGEHADAAELGYWLVPAARGRGLATAAARTLCAWGSEQLGLSRVELAILPTNLPSRRVAERLGATFAGVREASHEAGGRRWDLAIYSLRAARRIGD
jgi:RimJ/RimL family protein N-acetyltransferase